MYLFRKQFDHPLGFETGVSITRTDDLPKIPQKPINIHQLTVRILNNIQLPSFNFSDIEKKAKNQLKNWQEGKFKILYKNRIFLQSKYYDGCRSVTNLFHANCCNYLEIPLHWRHIPRSIPLQPRNTFVKIIFISSSLIIPEILLIIAFSRVD